MGEGDLGGELFILLDTVFLTFASSSRKFMNQHHQIRWTYLAQFLIQFNKSRNMIHSIPKAILWHLRWFWNEFASTWQFVNFHVACSGGVLDMHHPQWNFIGPIGYSVNTMSIGLDDYKLRSFHQDFHSLSPSTFILSISSSTHSLSSTHGIHYIYIIVENHHHDMVYPENFIKYNKCFRF